MMGIELLSLYNPVFSSYAFYGSALTLKVMAIGPLIACQCCVQKILANPDDYSDGRGVTLDDADMGRIRRNCQNAVENIPTFLVLGFFYVASQPSRTVALWHFRIFTICSVVQTLAYQFKSLQPAWTSAGMLSWVLCVSMGVRALREIGVSGGL